MISACASYRSVSRRANPSAESDWAPPSLATRILATGFALMFYNRHAERMPRRHSPDRLPVPEQRPPAVLASNTADDPRLSWSAREGSPLPLGVRWIATDSAYNFALYSKHADRVVLLA